MDPHLILGPTLGFYLDLGFTIKRLYPPSPMERDGRRGHCGETDPQLGRSPGVPEVGGGRGKDWRLSHSRVRQERAIRSWDRVTVSSPEVLP